MIPPSPPQRLLQLAEERRVSLAQLSRLIGRNASYLQQFVKKGSPRKLEETDRRTLARFFGVDEAELGGSQEISVGTAPREWIDVPRLALEASAGPGALTLGEERIGVLRFSARWLRDQGFDPAMLGALVVQGDSMEPDLHDGDEILVDRSRNRLSDGIQVVRVGDDLLVKRIEAGRPDRVILKSINPVYDPIELTPSEVELIGKVVWKCGRV